MDFRINAFPRNSPDSKLQHFIFPGASQSATMWIFSGRNILLAADVLGFFPQAKSGENT